MDSLSLELFKARLDRPWNNLGEWKVSGCNRMIFKLPPSPHHSVILWFYFHFSHQILQIILSLQRSGPGSDACNWLGIQTTVGLHRLCPSKQHPAPSSRL